MKRLSYLILTAIFFIVPSVLAIEFLNPTPAYNMSIEGNCESIMISVDVLLLDNSTPFHDEVLLSDFFGQPNITAVIDGYNNSEGWYGFVNVVVPEHNGTKIVGLLPFRTKRIIVPETVFSGFGGRVNGVCFVTGLKQESEGNTTVLLNDSVVLWANCDDNGYYNYTATSEGIYSDNEVMMRVEGLEYSFPDISWDGLKLSTTFVAFDNETIDVLVRVPFITGTEEYDWTFEVHTNQSEPEPIVIIKEVVYDDDDDDEPRRHSSSGGGGYVPVILKDNVTKNIAVNGSLPKDSIDEPLPSKAVNVIPEINNTPIMVSGSESIDKKSYAWVIWVVIGLLVCGVIGVGLYYLRKEE